MNRVFMVSALAFPLALGGCMAAVQGAVYALSAAAAVSTLAKNECSATIGTMVAGQPLNCGPR